MDNHQNFADFATDLLQVIGPVESRRMFGGHGIFLQGLMFAIVVKNTLYLKADKDTEDLFIQEGMEKFSYLRNNKPCYLNYYQAPEDALEQLEQTRYWGNIAFQTALNASAKKTKKAKR